jgi:flagellar biosynthesis anti-sigma factor FlgM
MRIDLNTQANAAANAGLAAEAENKAVAATSSNSQSGGDKASLSPDQARVQSLTAQLNQLPEIRQEKITELYRAIKVGTYNVTPEQTADALIADLRSRFAA